MSQDTPRRESESEQQPQGKIYLPNGSVPAEKAATERQRERRSEDQEYVPVIIKRTDETRRHPDDTFNNAICEGLEQ